MLMLLMVARDISKPTFSSVSSTSARLFSLPDRARASKPSVMLCDALCGFLRVSRQVFGLGHALPFGGVVWVAVSVRQVLHGAPCVHSSSVGGVVVGL